MERKALPIVPYIGRCVTRLFLGAISGFFSAIPFFNNHLFSETFRMDGRSLRGKAYFLKRWSYLLGGLIGFVFFFLVPVRYLAEGYPLALSCLFMGLSLTFGIHEIYCCYRYRDKKHAVSTILLLVVGLAIPFVLRFYPIDLPSLDTKTGLVVLFAVLLVGTFLVLFFGLSIGTVLYFSSIYLPFSDEMASIARLDNLWDGHRLFVIVLLLGILVGALIAHAVRRFKLVTEKSGFNAGIHVCTLIVIAAFDIKEPYFTDISTSWEAQLFVFLAVSIAALGIGIAFTCHGYRSLADEELPVERPSIKSEPEAEDKTVLSSHYRDLLVKDIFLPYPDEEDKEPAESVKQEKKVSGIDLDKLRKIQEEMRSK